MFSNESCKNAQACRFCWMCRHICPVAGSTGNEAWTPRARGLLVSMVERGTKFDESIAATMYMCSLCDACANDCVTGFKPSTFIREARMEAVARKVAPKSVLQEIALLQKWQNIFGKEKDPKLTAAVRELPEQADVLLYLGQTAANRCAATGLAAISLLRKAGVSFTVLRREPDSGAFLSELMGYTSEIQTQARRAADAIASSHATTLVALDPHDACIFRDQYAQWNLLPGIKVVTATAYLADLIADGKLRPEKIALKASFQDPCRLARDLGETQPARDILGALGVEIQELFLHGKMTRCCGGVVLDNHSPEVVRSMVKTREEDAVRIGSKCIVTACPDCQYLMSGYGDGRAEITDLFVLLDQHC